MSEKNKTKKQRSMVSRIVCRIVFSIAAALVITLLSVFIPVKVSRPADLGSMNFGKPAAFFYQSYPGIINEYLYPLYVFPQASCLGENTTINVGNFFISLAVNFTVIAVIVFVVFLLQNNKKRKRKSDMSDKTP